MSGEFQIRVRPESVEVWSISRLQFEPRGWQKLLRAELREALALLPVRPRQMLAATYAAVDDWAFVDLENVLLYNVGSGAVGGF